MRIINQLIKIIAGTGLYFLPFLPSKSRSPSNAKAFTRRKMKIQIKIDLKNIIKIQLTQKINKSKKYDNNRIKHNKIKHIKRSRIKGNQKNKYIKNITDNSFKTNKK